MGKDNHDLQHLSFLIGKWKTEGKVLETPISKSVRIDGADHYEWALDGKFIIHEAQVLMGNISTKVIEFIGLQDGLENQYVMHSFDNTGAFLMMHGSVEQGFFLITGEKMRSKLQAGEDGKTMRAHWEISEDGKNWMPWMELKFQKF